ncbi:alpha/beta hydrolase [Natronosalvus halobius]|uniref:alpha/beta hydrolase n=1 Tax=Natronosalvus halobius TaxID=2953746 RepID=UPI00209E4E0D|nr:alpha/beta hydrolase [Natronosalvus halobius]USZ73649.1 alpha/beta hydrolase [Natronosalvus halobius]
MMYREFSSQEELDAQYNLRETVDDFQSYADFYVEESEDARERLECHLDVSYGQTHAEHLDIFPAKRSDAPVVLFIHGGYWHSLSSKEFSFVAKGLVKAGVTTAVLNYALCPDVTIDEIVRQSRAAVAWLLENADEYGGDSSSVFVAGHSAGGHLTAMVLSTEWEEKYGISSEEILGGCAISGLFDLEPFPYTYLQPKLQLTWGQVRRNSPIRHVPDSAPPLIITYGESETSEIHRQSEEYFEEWKQNGLDGDIFCQPNKNHYTAIEDFLEPNSPLCNAILEMMEVK